LLWESILTLEIPEEIRDFMSRFGPVLDVSIVDIAHGVEK